MSALIVLDCRPEALLHHFQSAAAATLAWGRLVNAIVTQELLAAPGSASSASSRNDCQIVLLESYNKINLLSCDQSMLQLACKQLQDTVKNVAKRTADLEQESAMAAALDTFLPTDRKRQSVGLDSSLEYVAETLIAQRVRAQSALFIVLGSPEQLATTQGMECFARFSRVTGILRASVCLVYSDKDPLRPASAQVRAFGALEDCLASHFIGLPSIGFLRSFERFGPDEQEIARCALRSVLMHHAPLLLCGISPKDSAIATRHKVLVQQASSGSKSESLPRHAMAFRGIELSTDGQLLMDHRVNQADITPIDFAGSPLLLSVAPVPAHTASTASSEEKQSAGQSIDTLLRVFTHLRTNNEAVVCRMQYSNPSLPTPGLSLVMWMLLVPMRQEVKLGDPLMLGPQGTPAMLIPLAGTDEMCCPSTVLSANVARRAMSHARTRAETGAEAGAGDRASAGPPMGQSRSRATESPSRDQADIPGLPPLRTFDPKRLQSNRIAVSVAAAAMAARVHVPAASSGDASARAAKAHASPSRSIASNGDQGMASVVAGAPGDSPHHWTSGLGHQAETASLLPPPSMVYGTTGGQRGRMLGVHADEATGKAGRGAGGCATSGQMEVGTANEQDGDEDEDDAMMDVSLQLQERPPRVSFGEVDVQYYRKGSVASSGPSSGALASLAGAGPGTGAGTGAGAVTMQGIGSRPLGQSPRGHSKGNEGTAGVNMPKKKVVTRRRASRRGRGILDDDEDSSVSSNENSPPQHRAGRLRLTRAGGRKSRLLR